MKLDRRLLHACLAAGLGLSAAPGFAAFAEERPAFARPDEEAGGNEAWTRFRGPNGAGHSDSELVPVTWNESQYLWRVELPGAGHAAPVAWKGRIFTISAAEDGSTRWVVCLDARDGARRWLREYPSTPHKKHTLNSFASATPAVDELHVYVAWSTPQSYSLRALDHDGNEIWHRDLGSYDSQHSCGTSPIVYGDLVILGNDQDGVSSLVACDRRTGEIRWQVPRTSEVVSYATPCVFRRSPEAQPELIFNSGAHGITSIDPETGEKNWEFDAFDKRTVSSPIHAGGCLIGTCGSGAGGNYLAAVRPGGLHGAAPEPELAFKIDKSAPYCPTPVACGELLMLWSDKGVVTCVEAATGEIVWQRRVGGNYYGSPICIVDRVYCISDQGQVVVVRAAREFEELGRVELGEGSHSTPAVINGCLLLRTFSHLACVGPLRQP